MTPTVVVLIVIIGACVAAVRRLVPDQIYFFQGMFRYETDLGWPHGVQEDDGERAWGAHEMPAWEPEADELAWSEAIGTSTIVDLEGGRPPTAVPIVRVRAEVSTAARYRGP